MNEFLKLSWRKNITDDDYQPHFLSEEAVADSYVYKSFDKPIAAKTTKKVKLHLSKHKYVPGLDCYRPIRRRSLLTHFQKRHCLQAQKLLQSGKKQELLTEGDKFLLKIYNECQPKIIQENRLYLEFIKRLWLNSCVKSAKLGPAIYNYAWNAWKHRLETYLQYPQYYKEVFTLCMNYDENEAIIDFQHKQQALETGTLARFAHPNLKEQCTLKLNLLKKVDEQVFKNSQLPVSQDKNVLQIFETQDFDVVISSSALKQIIDYTSIKNKWIIPVVIQEISCKGDKKGKIVFVDKVLPKSNPTVQDLKYYTYKRLLKLNFCQYEAFSYPHEEIPIEDLDTKDEEEAVQPKRQIHHNVNYRIWSVTKTNCQNTMLKNHHKNENFKLLVRCKLDACEITEQGVLAPVSVKPKIEQQLQYGVNIASKSELSHDWTSLFFRLYSNLYRARIYAPKSEVVVIEKCSLQKVNSEAHTHYDYRPILGLGVLQKVLSELMNLGCGNYVLQHLPKNESFVSVMKQCEIEDNVFDLHAETKRAQIDYDTKPSWLPIDVNYILPAHEEHNQIPAVFHGFDQHQRGKTNVKGKVNTKRKSRCKSKKTDKKKTKE